MRPRVIRLESHLGQRFPRLESIVFLQQPVKRNEDLPGVGPDVVISRLVLALTFRDQAEQPPQSRCLILCPGGAGISRQTKHSGSSRTCMLSFIRMPVVVKSSTASRPKAHAAAKLSTGTSTAPVLTAASSLNRSSPPARPQVRSPVTRPFNGQL